MASKVVPAGQAWARPPCFLGDGRSKKATSIVRYRKSDVILGLGSDWNGNPAAHRGTGIKGSIDGELARRADLPGVTDAQVTVDH